MEGYYTYKELFDCYLDDLGLGILEVDEVDKQTIQSYEDKYECKILNVSKTKYGELQYEYQYTVHVKIVNQIWNFIVESGINNGTLLLDRFCNIEDRVLYFMISFSNTIRYHHKIQDIINFFDGEQNQEIYENEI